MCFGQFDGNKVPVCKVGDLRPGQQFRTPDRTTLLALSLPADFLGYTRCADIDSGAVASIDNSVLLGRDRAGRLYASRYLNKPGRGGPIPPTQVPSPTTSHTGGPHDQNSPQGT